MSFVGTMKQTAPNGKCSVLWTDPRTEAVMAARARQGVGMMWDRFMYGGLHPELRALTINIWFLRATNLAIVMSSLRLYFVYIKLSDNSDDNNQSDLNKFFCVPHLPHVCVSEVCILFFFFEMVTKWLAFGFAGYWVSSWNQFDGFITIGSFSIRVVPCSLQWPIALHWAIHRLQVGS